MKFVNIATGTIYDVTNEALLPFYEGSEAFKKVEEKAEKAEPVKKTTSKKKD